jgi:hypothetical protein
MNERLKLTLGKEKQIALAPTNGQETPTQASEVFRYMIVIFFLPHQLMFASTFKVRGKRTVEFTPVRARRTWLLIAQSVLNWTSLDRRQNGLLRYEGRRHLERCLCSDPARLAASASDEHTQTRRADDGRQ